MRLPRSHHIAEAKAAAGEAEHVAVGANHRLSGQLAGAVGGNGMERAMVFVCLMLPEIAIEPAARGVKDPGAAAHSHRFDHVVGQQHAPVEINGRLDHGASYVRVGSKMDDQVMPSHCVGQARQVLGVRQDHAQARIAGVRREMPAAARGKIVVDRYLRRVLSGKKMVDEMAAHKAGSADEHHPFCLRLRAHWIDSHLVAPLFKSGWLTIRCQITAVSPSVCGVRWPGLTEGTTMQASATWAAWPVGRPTMPKILADTAWA